MNTGCVSIIRVFSNFLHPCFMYSVDKSLNSFVEFNSNYCALFVALVNKIRKKKHLDIGLDNDFL